MKNEALILALVPGRKCCGLARVAADGAAVWRRVVPLGQLERSLNGLSAQLPEIVLLSAGGQSKSVRSMLIQMFGVERFQVIEMRATVADAKALYFADHPPSGLWKLVPRSMQTPAVAIEDYSAVALARQWLADGGKGSGVHKRPT